jgi:hypothetical protein
MLFFFVKSTVLGSREMCNFGVLDPCCNGPKTHERTKEQQNLQNFIAKFDDIIISFARFARFAGIPNV